MDWECSTIAENQSECTVTTTDAFVEASGGRPIVTRARWTFEDDKVVEEVIVGPVDPAAMDASVDA